MLGVGAYVTYTLNLWGPMLNMANAASAQALQEGKKRLREFLEASETGRQALEMPAARGLESHEMSSLKRRSKVKTDGVDEEDGEEI